MAIRGRSVSIASSVAVLFKRVDEYPNSGDPWKDDLENNIDSVIEGCDFGNAETHLEFWGRQIKLSRIYLAVVIMLCYLNSLIRWENIVAVPEGIGYGAISSIHSIVAMPIGRILS